MHAHQYPARLPIVVIFHGLSGGSRERYVLSMVHRLHHTFPCRVVVVNSRGCGGTKLQV
jgi:predicted alpha/beta-fold hydrolase